MKLEQDQIMKVVDGISYLRHAIRSVLHLVQAQHDLAIAENECCSFERINSAINAVLQNLANTVEKIDEGADAVLSYVEEVSGDYN